MAVIIKLSIFGNGLHLLGKGRQLQYIIIQGKINCLNFNFRYTCEKVYVFLLGSTNTQIHM